MSSLFTSLKAEIARVARKELRLELQSLRKATTSHRSEIAELKRHVKSMASQLKVTQRGSEAVANQSQEPKDVAQLGHIRFSADRFAAVRKKLEVTQSEMAALLEASPLSVHKWETGATQPRAAHLEKISKVMKMGKSEARALLQK